MLNWLFLDMDCYFASVEQQFRTELRDRPIGVVPVESEHTCCIAASTQAKRYGVKTGTRVKEARRLCPNLKLVQARPDFYVKIHHAIVRAVEQCAPVEKVYSIDEMAIRLLGREKQPDQAVILGRQIKEKLREEIGEVVTCSVGISPTRLLAKTASDMCKPDGLAVVNMNDLPNHIEHLALNDIPGIGPGMFARLKQHGITTIRQLWDLSLSQTCHIWDSVQGEHWWHGFHGNDYPEPGTRRRSMSHAHVLGPRWRNPDGVHAVMTRLLHKASARLRHHGYWANRLAVKVSSETAEKWVDGTDLPACQDTITILEHFERLWQGHGRFFTQRYRPKKVGITVGGLVPTCSQTHDLFMGMHKRRDLCQAIDNLNRRWGTHTVYFGGMHGCRHRMDDKIAFGRIPDEAVRM